MTFPIMIDPDPERVETDGQGSIAWRNDGTIEVLDGPPEDERSADDPRAHDTNLATFLSDSQLAGIAEDLIEAFESDKEAREPWERRFAKGLEIVGYVDPPDDGSNPIKGAARVVYPLIAEACTQFNARALEELFPASGPVKTIVVGDKTPEREKQARRVEEYMNYQITEEDPAWQDEDDRMLAVLPLEGMAWKKVYHDERRSIRTSKYVPARDVFLPYSATSVHSTPRLCHRLRMKPNDVKFEQRTGNWLDVELHEPPGSDEVERDEAQREVDEAEGVQPSASEHDRVHTILEFYVDYNLPEFEHVDDKTGDPTGFALPYIITIELDSRKVLKILRNWRENDKRYRKRGCMIAYRFLPGLGFYGFGFLHVIGGLNEAATGALRALLDSAGRENWAGGFVSNDVGNKIKSETLHLAMGEYKQVDASAEELAKAFYTPPVPHPSEALFKALGFLVEAGKSYTSTTEAMTGSAKTTGPVGTLVQLIEQGSKVFSGIHKRLHKAKRDEYRLLAELNGVYIPAEGYPYDGAQSRQIFAQDFGPEVDVLPVSDPNIYSSHQRIALSQALLDLSMLEPAMYRKHAVHRRMLEALKVPAIEEIMIPEEEVQPQPSPDEIKAQAEAERDQAKLALEQEKMAAELQIRQAELALRQQEVEMAIAQKQADIALKQAAQEADELRRQQAADAEEARKNAMFWNEERRKDEKHRAELARSEEKADQQIEIAKEQADARAEAAKKAAAAKPAASKKGPKK